MVGGKGEAHELLKAKVQAEAKQERKNENKNYKTNMINKIKMFSM